MPLFQSAELIAGLKEVEEHLQQALRSREALLEQVTSQLVLSGGKRIRPALTLLGASFGTRQDPAVTKIAAASELLHTATLVHDDIIDHSPLRRGQPTVQATYGNEIAVFTGDWLLTKAMLLLAEANAGQHMTELAKTMIHICEGEVSQFASRYQRVSIYNYLRRIHGKTAALFSLSIAAGAEQTQAPTRTIRALSRYGIFFGMAFQIYDDMLDYMADRSQLGKPVGVDIRSGIYTLPLLYALEDKEAAAGLEPLLSSTCSPQQALAILQLVSRTDGLKRSQQLVQRYVDKARQAIAPLPETAAKAELLALTERLFSC
ncbi:MAG: polyprenyl synthetase family protein [Firmicutes bacterium]|nr:polyprenyl synthetase family protein [Bacillota bacterium]